MFINQNKIFFYLKNSFNKIRYKLGDKIINLLYKNKIDENFFKKLEEQLLISDVSINVTGKIINLLIKYVKYNKINNLNVIYNKLREEMKFILNKVNKSSCVTDNVKPYIILIVGINGVGKTTTIAKLANYYKIQGKRVLLVAGDTFRAAAIKQLQIWGDYINIPVVSRCIKSDPASVVFDAIQKSKINNNDILIIDTAGRLHNNIYLMDKLNKIIKVIKKFYFNAPHEIMLVIDSCTGQNAINQVNMFNNILKLSGIILSKMDGTAKGGIILTLVDKFKIPIKYIGIGENIEDLRVFNSDEFIDALLPVKIF